MVKALVRSNQVPDKCSGGWSGGITAARSDRTQVRYGSIEHMTSNFSVPFNLYHVRVKIDPSLNISPWIRLLRRSTFWTQGYNEFDEELASIGVNQLNFQRNVNLLYIFNAYNSSLCSHCPFLKCPPEVKNCQLETDKCHHQFISKRPA